MIDTLCRNVLSREAAEMAASGAFASSYAFRGAAAAKPQISHDAEKRAFFGRRSGIICPILAPPPRPRTARKAGFLGGFRDEAPIPARIARGDINESAELSIIAAGIAPAGGR